MPTYNTRIDKRSLVLSMEQELKKEYYVLDGSGRVTSMYQALADAADGENCLKTTFSYDNVTYTTTVTKTKEEAASWDATWDI